MKKTSRGFTLLETVLALTVIVIVSAATLTLVLSSNTATRRAMERQEAAGYTADLVACYRVAQNEDDFFKAAAFALGADLDAEGEGAIPDTRLSARVTYTETQLIAEVFYTDDDADVLSHVTFRRGGGS